MDNIKNDKIPKVIVDAFKYLHERKKIKIVEDLQIHEKDKSWHFKCLLKIKQTSGSSFSDQIKLKVLIPNNFPYEEIYIFSETEKFLGFPHQEAISGKLCLHEQDLAPRNYKRLYYYLQWAEEWAENVINDKFLSGSSLYELPDFRIDSSKLSIKVPYQTFFNETKKSFKIWNNHICKSGEVSAFTVSNSKSLFVDVFKNEFDEEIKKSDFKNNKQPDESIVGKWVILPDIIIKNHRPPSNYGEIADLFRIYDLDFYKLLKSAWLSDNRPSKIAFLLVGFPIPKKIKEQFSEINWQPIWIHNYRHLKGELDQKKKKKRKMWALMLEDEIKRNSNIAWGNSTNINYDRLHKRSNLSKGLLVKKIGVVGCGAIGCLVSESLARGGIKNLRFFDKDYLEYGNICRHSLSGLYVGHNKAVALSHKLTLSMPLANIQGFELKIPFSMNQVIEERIVEFNNCKIIFDCTANVSAGEWLSNYCFSKGQRLICIFINFKADIITIAISGCYYSANDIIRDLYSLVIDGQIKKGDGQYLDSSLYNYEPAEEESIIEGIGCWHATFPALNNHINILVHSALDIINNYYLNDANNGLGVILQRNLFNKNDLVPFSMVNCLVNKTYR